MAEMELRSQQYSRKSFEQVESSLKKIKQECEQKKQNEKESREKYKTFAKRFPSLIHTCGLEQAISFANSKNYYEQNFKDLEMVLQKTKVLKDGESLISFSREVSLPVYLRLSKEALVVAGWLKKYAEALIEE